MMLCHTGSKDCAETENPRHKISSGREWYSENVTGKSNYSPATSWSVTRWLYNDGVTSGLVLRTGDVFWRHLFERVAYLQDERQPARVSPKESVCVRVEQRLPFILLVGNPHKQVASENVSHFWWEWLHRYSHLEHIKSQMSHTRIFQTWRRKGAEIKY